MRTGPINSYSLKWSLVMHGLLLVLAVVLPFIPSLRPKEVAIPLDFTVVLEANTVEPNVPPEPEQEQPMPDEPEPEPDEPPPVPLPDPPKDAVVLDKKKPDPPKPKPKPEVKPPPKPKEKPKPPKEKAFKKGARVTRPVTTPPPKEDFTKLKPVTSMPVTDKRLTRAEIDKALRDGAKPGTRNQIPENEISRCVLLVKNALYEAWEQPGVGDAGTRPTLLDIRLDSTGRIVSYRIRQSSGSAYFDQTVLKAAANAQPIRGLSMDFLKQYETLTVEFKLE